MADIIKRVRYFYTEVPDKPGEGARLLQLLEETGVPLLAFSAFPKGRRAQVDFVPADAPTFRAAMRKARVKLVGPKTGFLVQGEDRIGALCDVVDKLAEAKINITALDAVSTGTGYYGALLWVKPKDVNRAAKVISAS